MPAINITLPIHIMLRIMVTAQVSKNVTGPSIQNPSLATTTEAPILPPGYVAFPEYGVAYKYFDTKVTYNDAMSRCWGENGHLAVIDSREKVEKMISKFGTSLWSWIGIYRLDDTEGWKTIDGKSRSAFPWADGEPGGLGSCAFLWGSQNGIGDFPCQQKTSYLCEIALPRN